MRGAAIVVGAAALVLAVAGYGVLRSATVARWLTARIAAALGPQVAFAGARVSVWPAPAVVLDDVRLLGPGGEAGPSARAVRCVLDVAALFERRVGLANVVVDHPSVTLERDADGTLHAGPVLPALPAGASSAGVRDLPPIRVRDGAVEIIDRAAATPPVAIRLRDVRATLDAIRPSATAPFTVSAQVDGGGEMNATGQIGPFAASGALGFTVRAEGKALPLALTLRYLAGAREAGAVPAVFDVSATLSRAGDGAVQGEASLDVPAGSVERDGVRLDAPLRVTTQVRVRDGALALDQANAELSSLAYRGATAEGVRATFAYADAEVRMNTLEFRSCGGAWRSTGRMSQGAFDGTVDATGVDADRLRAALALLGVDLGIDRAAGTLALSASGRFDDALRARLLLRLDDGAIDWGAVRIDGPGRFAADLAVDNGGATLRNAQANAARVSVGGAAGDAADAAFTYADDTLHFAPLRFQSAGGTWRYDGSVQIDRRPMLDGRLRAAHVAGGALLRDLAAPADVRADEAVFDLDATLSGTWGDRWGGNADVQLTAGSLGWGPLHATGPARLRARLDAAGGAVSLTAAQAQAARVAVERFRATGVESSFTYAGRRLHVADLRFRACGGAWAQRGWIAFGAPPTFAGEVRVTGVVPEELLAAIADRPSDVDFDSLDGESELRGRWTGAQSWAREIDASGSLLLRGGSTASSSVITALWRALFRSDRLLKTIERPTRIDHLSQSFTLHRGRLTTDDLSLVTSDYSLTGLGTIGLDGSVDLQSRITLTTAGVQRLIAMTAVPIPTGGLLSLPPIPARITGTLPHPTIVPEVSHVPVATLQWLLGTVGGTVGTVGGALGQGVDAIRRGIGDALGGERNATPAPAP